MGARDLGRQEGIGMKNTAAAKKRRIVDAIKHQGSGKVPTMYRAEPSVNERLASYFKIGDLHKHWYTLIECLGADNYSDGETLGGFTTYFPKYIGPDFKSVFEINRFDIWGIKPVQMYHAGQRNIVFSKYPPMRQMNEIEDIKRYPFPRIEWFDFEVYKNNSEQIVYQSAGEQEEVLLSEIKRSDAFFLNASCQNSIFMVSTYLRGTDKMFMDLALNQRYSEMLIEKIGQFMVEFHKKNMESIGEKIDLYGMWDDFADQDGLMISPDMWRKYYKPWDKLLIEEAKKYGLLVCFHVCGNCSDIIPDLIDMGVDMLDPVQVSAKNMDLVHLKRQFGKDICFHGGLDAQKFLLHSSPAQIKEEIKRIDDLFGQSGGLILGPSHYLTPDIPLENILAIYGQ